MSLGNGADLETPAASARPGRVVEQSSVNTQVVAANPTQAQELIAVLAELFPVVFVAARWQKHRPLKIGIDRDLIERGVLLPDECRSVFRRYCPRLMYQRALAAGGARYDLNGEPAGEVTAEQMAGGRSVVTVLEAKRAAKAKAMADERKAAKLANSPAPPKAPRKVQAGPTAPAVKPARLGLAELKAAACARREAPHG